MSEYNQIVVLFDPLEDASARRDDIVIALREAAEALTYCPYLEADVLHLNIRNASRETVLAAVSGAQWDNREAVLVTFRQESEAWWVASHLDPIETSQPKQ